MLKELFARRPPATAPAPAGAGGFAGVLGGPDPSAALRRLGVDPAWRGDGVVLGGGPVETDRSGRWTACGDAVLDNAEELRRALGLPGAGPLALLAELVRAHGADAGAHALGMYAVAVWDAAERRLLLLRDGAGARTAYLAGDAAQGWSFAARLRALRRAPGVPGDVDPVALRDYLTCAFVPGERTMWKGVRELRPGTALALPDGREHVFWEPRERVEDPDAPLEAHAARLRALLEEAVRARLPRSGPVGVYLSGGVDSSLVTALAARQAPGPVHTYALHFGGRYPNELRFSGMVAEHCGTVHHVLELPAATIREHLAESLAALDDPIGDPLTTPNLLLGRAASRDVEVILNGEGGDPSFGGPKNTPMLLHALYGTPDELVAAYLRSFEKCYDDLPRLLTPEVRAELEGGPPAGHWFAGLLGDGGMRHYLNRLLDVNVRFKGADHILTKVANLTTANGLLGRSPLADRRVIDAGFAIPPEHKLAGTVEKAVLKAAVADLLPHEVVHRPKSGMLVPVQAWFAGELRAYARDLLLDRRARTRPYFERATVREWLDTPRAPKRGVRIWLLLTMELWMRVNE
ncbi:MAG TPA: asparagine synthase-related protein [Longimicrobiaceae bacterium]